MTSKNRNSSAVQQKSKTHRVRCVTTGLEYEVISGGSGNSYTVKVRDYGFTCSCAWGKTKPPVEALEGCSHMRSVLTFIQAVGVGEIKTAVADVVPQQRQQRTLETAMPEPVGALRRQRTI